MLSVVLGVISAFAIWFISFLHGNYFRERRIIRAIKEQGHYRLLTSNEHCIKGEIE